MEYIRFYFRFAYLMDIHNKVLSGVVTQFDIRTGSGFILLDGKGVSTKISFTMFAARRITANGDEPRFENGSIRLPKIGDRLAFVLDRRDSSKVSYWGYHEYYLEAKELISVAPRFRIMTASKPADGGALDEPMEGRRMTLAQIIHDIHLRKIEFSPKRKIGSRIRVMWLEKLGTNGAWRNVGTSPIPSALFYKERVVSKAA